ncbi:MAG: membrane protein [Candidatus Sumerlaeia bacterium]
MKITRHAQPAVVPAALLALALIIYLPWIRNDFVYDDVPEIVEWPLVHSPANIGRFFTTADVGLYRPLKYTAVSLLWAAGGGTPWPFHLASVLAHAAAAGMVFIVFRRLEFSIGYAAFGAALFLVHPVQTESVYWISALSAPLSAIFFFAALSTALNIAVLPPNQPAGRRLALMSACLATALLIRESAIVFPAFLILYLLAPLRPLNHPSPRRRLVLATGLSTAVVLLYWLVRTRIMAQQPHRFDYFTGSLLNTLMTVPWLVTRYIVQFALPLKLSVYHWPAVVTSPLQELFILPVLWLTVLGAAAWRWRRAHPQVLFFSGCFAVGLVPVLNIVPINSIYAERYLYLPMFGLCGLAAWGAARVNAAAARTGRAEHLRALRLGGVGLLLVLSAISAVRGRVWRNNVTLFTDAAEKTPPGAIIPRFNLAKALADAGRGEEAADVYRDILTIAPNHLPSHLNLSGLLIRAGQLDAAEQVLLHAQAVAPAHSFVLNGLGTIWFHRGDDARALEFFRAASEASPPNPQAFFNAGMACKRLGDISGALRWFEKAIDLAPDYAAARRELTHLRQSPRVAPSSP